MINSCIDGKSIRFKFKLVKKYYFDLFDWIDWNSNKMLTWSGSEEDDIFSLIAVWVGKEEKFQNIFLPLPIECFSLNGFTFKIITMKTLDLLTGKFCFFLCARDGNKSCGQCSFSVRVRSADRFKPHFFFCTWIKMCSSKYLLLIETMAMRMKFMLWSDFTWQFFLNTRGFYLILCNFILK